MFFAFVPFLGVWLGTLGRHEPQRSSAQDAHGYDRRIGVQEYYPKRHELKVHARQHPLQPRNYTARNRIRSDALAFVIRLRHR